jgi:hypothetical protein
MTRKEFLYLPAAALWAAPERRALVLDAEIFRPYVDSFNAMAKEDVVNYIPDAHAWGWMKQNVPFFACPDRDVEQIYYFRWWTYRKHIKQTPAGFIITEFLKPVNHAGEYNALSCAFGHHVAEGRWLHDQRFIEQYCNFWLRSGENGGLRKNLHQFSGWAAATLYERWLVDANLESLLSYLGALVLDYTTWERERLTTDGLFWQRDVSDGMESSVSGGRTVRNLRPSINSYMYGNAQAIGAIAGMARRELVVQEYLEKAGRLKQLVQQRLWNKDAAFFETRVESGEFVPVRENIGFTPWYFDLPDDTPEYQVAWKQLTDPEGFHAPFGPTTVERRSPKFAVAYQGDDCQWNGPSWPFATTITLRALANFMNGYTSSVVNRQDYFDTFLIYTHSQHLKRDDGLVIPFIDEDLNPLTGEWLARARKMARTSFYGRGDYYNHSGYADLVITGLVGLRPRADNSIEVNPLVPADKWDWFCLDRVPYHGRVLTILWDRSGKKFGRGKGLRVFAGGRPISQSATLTRTTGRLA